MNNYKFDTLVIHAGQDNANWQGATRAPIYQTAAHAHDTAQSLSDTFAGRDADQHIYMRLSNPTNRTLEEKITLLENGAGAVTVSSGMAAVNNTIMALCRAGDEFVVSDSLFLSTRILVDNVLRKYDINGVVVPSTDVSAYEAAITEKTRFIYMETIGNPRMDIPDIAAIAEVAHRNGLPLVVDNTMASPYLVRPIDLGADIVLHSTTKFFNGHGSAVGGIIIDAGNFDWSGERFADFAPFVERKGKLAFLDRVWREIHINFGTSPAPMHSYLTMLGLDTMALRMERHMANAKKVAEFLNNHKLVEWVNYPGLQGHPSHETARKQFGGKGFGSLLAFGLKDTETCMRCIDGLKMVNHLANLGDAKTLIIHPRTTQFVSFCDETCKKYDIKPDLLRLSIGIEAAEDIIADLEQALVGAAK